MKKIPFSEKELEVLKVVPSPWGDAFPPSKVYNRPISEKENIRLAYTEKNPVYYMDGDQGVLFSPKVVPDNIARGFVIGSEVIDNDTEAGGPDMFGIEWEYVPQVGGSMVRPGKPLLDDVNDWKEVIKFPDVDSWDWEGSVKANAQFFEDNKGRWISFWLLTGAWFERLVSFMEFGNAVMALVDEDQQDAVKELFEKTTEVMCKIVDKVAEYFPDVDCICVHDDWGSQAQPFFSQETGMEMIVPYMKKLVDHIHAKGFAADLHSCGHIEKRIECFIEAGWDSWYPQPMNDSVKMYEEYGDKIIIAVTNQQLSYDAPEEEQRACARDYVERFCKPGKPSIQGYMEGNDAFVDEAYRLSRKAYMGE